MKMGAFCGGSYHQAGWRHPDSTPAADIGSWIDLARKLEAAKFDMMFVADTASPANPTTRRSSAIPRPATTWSR